MTTIPALDPQSLKKDAAAITAWADEVALAIRARKAAMPKGKTLFVVAGEDHDLPAHRLFHSALLQELRQDSNLAACFEIPDNLRNDAYAVKTGTSPSKAQRDFLKAQDGLGALSVKSLLYLGYDDGAAWAQAALFASLLAANTPVRFTDAAYTDNNCLDVSDPQTLTALKLHFKGAAMPSAPLDAAEPAAIAARNLLMALRAEGFAARTEAGILFHQCGNAHVAGDVPDKYPGSESLSAALLRRGADVLALPILSDEFSAAHIPRNHGLKPHEIVQVSGLPTWTAFADKGADLPTEVAEAAYVAGVLSAQGMPVTPRMLLNAHTSCSRQLDALFAAGPRGP